MNLLRIAARVAASRTADETVSQRAGLDGMDEVGQLLERVGKAVSRWREDPPAAGVVDALGGDVRYYLRADTDGWKLMFIHPEIDECVYSAPAGDFDASQAAKAAAAHWSGPAT